MDNYKPLSSFGKWIAPINMKKIFSQMGIDEPVQGNKIDYYTKKLTTEKFIRTMLYALLHKFDGLRSISDAFCSEDLQKKVGLESISAAQLSRKNRELDPEILATIFADLVAQIRGFHRQKGHCESLKLIDSSTITLNAKDFKWATFTKTKSGVKLHLRLVFMENGQVYPDKMTMTPAKDHDRGQLEVLIDDHEATYVFDRGYMDFKMFDQMTDDSYTFVSKVKKNTVIHEIKSLPLAKETDVQSDKVVYVGHEKAKTKHQFRLIEVQDTQGNDLRLITNRFDVSAEEISQMYRSRWKIELFSNGSSKMSRLNISTEKLKKLYKIRFTVY